MGKKIILILWMTERSRETKRAGKIVTLYKSYNILVNTQLFN